MRHAVVRTVLFSSVVCLFGFVHPAWAEDWDESSTDPISEENTVSGYEENTALAAETTPGPDGDVSGTDFAAVTVTAEAPADSSETPAAEVTEAEPQQPPAVTPDEEPAEEESND